MLWVNLMIPTLYVHTPIFYGTFLKTGLFTFSITSLSCLVLLFSELVEISWRRCVAIWRRKLRPARQTELPKQWGLTNRSNFLWSLILIWITFASRKSCDNAIAYCIKVRYSEKATKNWKNHQLCFDVTK